MIIHGANIKFDERDKNVKKGVVKGWRLPWLDIEGIRAYLVTKRF